MMSRPAPNFWWNFQGPDHDVVVKSDWPGGECLARFKAAPGEKYRDAQIFQADALIQEYRTGRKTPQWGCVA
jgi:hypothetical protein